MQALLCHQSSYEVRRCRSQRKLVLFSQLKLVRIHTFTLVSVEIAFVHEGDSTTIRAGLLTSESTNRAAFPPNLFLGTSAVDL